MIKVNQIEKNYGKFHLNCTMEVPDGCVTGLIGENGAGKSTVFKAIENLIFLDGGSIEVFGKPHTELNAKDREQIAIVLSDATFSNVYTIKDVARIMGSVYPDFDKKKFMGLVERFRLPKNQKVKEFSTGMKAKLKLFLALCHKARLLILDEPTAGMDVVARDEVLTLFYLWTSLSVFRICLYDGCCCHPEHDWKLCAGSERKYYDCSSLCRDWSDCAFFLHRYRSKVWSGERKSYVAFRVYGHLLFILHGCCISRKELSRKKGSFPSVV